MLVPRSDMTRGSISKPDVLNRGNQANAPQHSNVNLQANSSAYDWLAILLLLLFLLFRQAIALRTIDQLSYLLLLLLLRQAEALNITKSAPPPPLSAPSSSPMVILNSWPGQHLTFKRKPWASPSQLHTAKDLVDRQ